MRTCLGIALLAAALAGCASGTGDASAARVERCVDRLLARSEAPGASEDELRGYLRRTYCESYPPQCGEPSLLVEASDRGGAMRQPITPYLLYEDADAAVRFARDAFGFVEVERATGAAGGVHVELRLEETGAQLYLGAPVGEDFRNPREAGRTSLVYVRIADVDAHHERAKAAGAEIVEEPAEQPYGARRYGCRDPQGHEWFFAQEAAAD